MWAKNHRSNITTRIHSTLQQQALQRIQCNNIYNGGQRFFGINKFNTSLGRLESGTRDVIKGIDNNVKRRYSSTPLFPPYFVSFAYDDKQEFVYQKKPKRCLQNQLMHRSHSTISRTKPLDNTFCDDDRLKKGLLQSGELYHYHQQHQQQRYQYRYFASSIRNEDLKKLEEQTDELLNIFTHNRKKDSHTKRATLMHFDTLMKSWSNQKSFYAAQRCEDLLMALEQNYDRIMNNIGTSDKVEQDTSEYLVPNVFSYNHVLQAYTQSQGGEPSAIKAEEILYRMIRRSTSSIVENRSSDSQPSPSPSLPPKPTRSTFHTVMDAWAKSQSKNSGRKAEEIYTLLEEMSYSSSMSHNRKDRHMNIHPNAQSLAIVFDAWANSSHEEAVNRVMTTLHHVIHREQQAMGAARHGSDSDHGNNNDSKVDEDTHWNLLRLNKVVFHSVLHTLANSKDGGLDTAMKAEEVMNLLQSLHQNSLYNDSEDDGNMDANNDKNHDDDLLSDSGGLKPNTKTWSILLQCWTNAVNHSDNDGGEYAAEHAESLLQTMEEMYQNGEDIFPNSYCFASCIQAWSKCQSKRGALHASEILNKKEKLYELTGDDDLKPNTIEYNVCLGALCNAENGTLLKEARVLLSKMKTIGIIDTASFNTIMSAYTKSNGADNHLHVWNLFQEMQEIGIQPDTITYNTVMAMLGHKRDPDSIDRVIQILESMIHSKEIKLTVRSFTTVLNAIAKSQLDEKVEPARKVFRHLINLDQESKDESNKPDVTVFGAFLACCANQNGSVERKRNSLKLALGTYEQLCNHPNYGKPNEYIYGALLKATNRLSQDKDEKLRLLETLFLNCRNEGNVSSIVLNIVLKSSPPKLRNKLFKDCVRLKSGKILDRNTNSELSISIPIDWCYNVLRKNRPANTH